MQSDLLGGEHAFASREDAAMVLEDLCRRPGKQRLSGALQPLTVSCLRANLRAASRNLEVAGLGFKVHSTEGFSYMS